MPEIDIKETIKKIVVEEIKLLSPSYNTPRKIKEFVKIAEKSIQTTLKFYNSNLLSKKDFNAYLNFLQNKRKEFKKWEEFFKKLPEAEKEGLIKQIRAKIRFFICVRHTVDNYLY